jgi:hypothetical protein
MPDKAEQVDQIDEVATAGQRVFELFGSCAGDPDDKTVGRAADDTLAELDAVLARGEGAAGNARLTRPGPSGGPRDLATQVRR